MKFGFVLPNGDARVAADFARDAEAAGWDGFFVYEPVWGMDAWVSLAAAAMQTEKIHLGTMLTPPSRMRPWKLASETVTLDHLSNGRTILAVGLGAVDTGFEAFGETTDRKARAELLDESLEILTGLWKGKAIRYDGKHYQISPTPFPPPPATVQQPRIPIWVVGLWPYPKSLARALKYEGMLVSHLKDEDGQFGPATADQLREIRAFVDERRGPDFDLIWEGAQTPGDDPDQAAEIVAPWAEAGATWWIESRWQLQSPGALDQVRERIQQGPPRY
jgi:alkanesulfonate monooxygenase SsuD/methylene tetrahydromethanopterin reductase-like flavin-dependent oxidoreductase (luciferase family)